MWFCVRDSSGKPCARHERKLGTDSPAERECGRENDVRRGAPLRHAKNSARASAVCEGFVRKLTVE